MVARVEKRQEGYTIVLTQKMMDDLCLSEGSAVDLRALPADAEKPAEGRQIRYATKDEVAASFERTLPRHEATYRELAK